MLLMSEMDPQVAIINYYYYYIINGSSGRYFLLLYYYIFIFRSLFPIVRRVWCLRPVRPAHFCHAHPRWVLLLLLPQAPVLLAWQAHPTVQCSVHRSVLHPWLHHPAHHPALCISIDTLRGGAAHQLVLMACGTAQSTASTLRRDRWRCHYPHISVLYIIMAYIVMAYIVIAYRAMTYIVMAYMVMA